MLRLISILLLSGFLYQYFGSVGIFIHFKINQEFIAKVLCINREKPELQCNGHCQLSKELQAHEEQQQSDLPVERLKQEIQYFWQPIVVTTIILSLLSEKASFIAKPVHGLPQPFLSGVFHPPCL